MALICRDLRRFACSRFSLSLPFPLSGCARDASPFSPVRSIYLPIRPSLPTLSVSLFLSLSLSLLWPPSRDCPGSHAFSFRQIHFARFPFLRIDCACVCNRTRRATNDHERLSLHFELRSMRTLSFWRFWLHRATPRARGSAHGLSAALSHLSSWKRQLEKVFPRRCIAQSVILSFNCAWRMS